MNDQVSLLFSYSFANVAQSVERVHGKDEVPSSILGIGSTMEIHFNTIQESKVTDTLCARYTELLTQLKGTPVVILKTQLEEVCAREASELLLFMYVEGEIAGMAQASFLCVPGNYTAYINHVVVDEAHRGKGFGGMLMEALHAQAKKQWPSLQKLTLTSSPTKGTQGFYTRLGYAMRTKESGDETIVYVKKV